MSKQAVIPVKATLNRNPFSAGLKAMRSEVHGFASGIAGGIKNAITSPIAGIAALAGGVLGAAGFASGIKGALDLGGSLEDLKNQTGESADKLLVFQQVLKDNGEEAEAAGIILNKMSKAIIAASDAPGGLDAIKRLGLSVEELRAKSPVEQFKAIGAALSKIDDPAKKSALAMEIFGKTGGKLLGALGDTQGFEAAAKSIGRQAQILSASSADFDRVSDRLGRAGLKLQGFFVGAASTMLPALDALTEKLDGLDFAEQGERFGEGIKKGVEFLAGISKKPEETKQAGQDLLTAGMAGLGNMVLGNVAKLARVFGTAVDGAVDGLTGDWTDAMYGPGGASEKMLGILDGKKDLFGAGDYLDAASASAKKVQEAGADMLKASDEYCNGLQKMEKRFQSTSSLNSKQAGLVSGGLGGNFYTTFSANPDMHASDMSKSGGHLLFTARERRRFEDEAVAAGGTRSASSVGGYNTVRRGDHARQIQHAKDVALGKSGTEKTNELLDKILKPTVDTANTLKAWN